MYIELDGRTFKVTDEGKYWQLTHKTAETSVTYKFPKNASPELNALIADLE